MGSTHKKDKRSKKEKKAKKDKAKKEEKIVEGLEHTSKHEVTEIVKDQPLTLMTNKMQSPKDGIVVFHQGFGDNKMITPNANGNKFTFQVNGSFRLELEADLDLTKAATIDINFFLPEVESKISPLLKTSKIFDKGGPVSIMTTTIVPIHAPQDLRLMMTSAAPFIITKAKMIISPV